MAAPDAEERARRIRKDAGLGCVKCDFTGVLSGKLGSKWTHYPQIKCECQERFASKPDGQVQP